MSTTPRRARHYWTDDEMQFLRDWYPHVLTVDLAAALELPLARVLSKANAMGVHKTRELIAETARERSTRPGHGSSRTRFAPGAEPWNKGGHFVAGGRSGETRFKPGHRPHTWVPIGSHRVVDGCLERKITDLPGPSRVRWAPLARLVWEAAHGPVPADHMVVYRQGRQTTDPAAVTLDALELVSRAEQMRRNTLHRYPREIVQLIQLRGVLNRRIRQAERHADRPAERQAEPAPTDTEDTAA